MKKIGSVLAVLASALLLFFCVIWLNNKLNFSKSGITVEGRVIELVEKKSSGHVVSYFPLVEFSLEDGKTKRLQLSQSSDAYPMGEAIPLIYDKENTDLVSINSGFGLYLFPSLGILFSLVLLFLSASSVKEKFSAN